MRKRYIECERKLFKLQVAVGYLKMSSIKLPCYNGHMSGVESYNMT